MPAGSESSPGKMLISCEEVVAQAGGGEGHGLKNALDELRFGRGGTLDLRTSLPSSAEAAARAESWLRQRQVEQAGEVLIITGRGNNSEGGVPVVREAIHRVLLSLRRRGVVGSISEHTPGSFAVALAPIRSLFEVPRRRREHARQPVPRTPAELHGLDAETQVLLRRLAECSLQALGAPEGPAFVESEMLRQFSALNSALPARGTVGREALLRDAIRRAIEEYDEG
jgi:hypothetical protein